jgi:hypothetical protein
MADIEAVINVIPERLKALAFNEADVHISLENKGENIYWIECVAEIPHPISFAPDRKLYMAKTLIGILEKKGTKDKRIKLFTDHAVTPGSYNIKLTFYVYDGDGAIADRIEIYKNIECASEMNAKVL